MLKLCIYCLLCHQASSSFYELSRENKTLANDETESEKNVLEHFFGALRLSYLQKRDVQHVTIVGGNDDDVEQTQSMLKMYPFIICKNVEKCSYSKSFSRGSFMVIFMDDLSLGSFNKNVLILSKCVQCRILFLSSGTINRDDIFSLFSSAYQHNIRLFELANVNENQVELYTNYLTTNCSSDVKLFAIWRPGSVLKKFQTWNFEFMKNLNKCPVFMSSLTFKPKIIIEEGENGSLSIKGGGEGKLISALAEKLNFSLILRYPSVVDRMKFSRKTSIINDVAAGIADIGIGRIRPTNDLQNVVSVSLAYDRECITWGVPRFMKWSNEIIWEEFSWQVWALVCLVFGVISAVAAFLQRINLLKQGKRILDVGFARIVLDIFAVTLGNPVTCIFTSSGGKLMLFIYLSYVIVLTTAYKTHLAAILATHEEAPLIIDVEGIINANIKFGGSSYDYDILKDQVNDNKFNSKILERFEINNDDVETMKQLKYDHNYAFLTRLSSMNYHKLQMIKQHESISFDTLKTCTLTHHTVIIFDKLSWLRKPINKIIQNLIESGIMEHWNNDGIDTEKILGLQKDQKAIESRSIHTFQAVFILYFFCIALCFIVFFTELIIAKC